jgi:hypothetical protein
MDIEVIAFYSRIEKILKTKILLFSILFFGKGVKILNHLLRNIGKFTKLQNLTKPRVHKFSSKKEQLSFLTEFLALFSTFLSAVSSSFKPAEFLTAFCPLLLLRIVRWAFSACTAAYKHCC